MCTRRSFPLPLVPGYQARCVSPLTSLCHWLSNTVGIGTQQGFIKPTAIVICTCYDDGSFCTEPCNRTLWHSDCTELILHLSSLLATDQLVGWEIVITMHTVQSNFNPLYSSPQSILLSNPESSLYNDPLLKREGQTPGRCMQHTPPKQILWLGRIKLKSTQKTDKFWL